MPSKADVARVLRNARDLMNTNGRHWIKGDLRIEINEDILIARDEGRTSIGSISPKAQLGDVAYCAWGGIAEVADELELRVEAMEALVQIIDPYAWNDYLLQEQHERAVYDEEVAYSDEFRQYYPTFEHYRAEQLEGREEFLGDRIANWNDADQRTWDEVRASLTKAAAKVKAQKSLI